VTNLSGWLPKPAGKLGPIRAGADGHLYGGSERIRFFGVNICFGANFPRKADAEKVAGRLAKFGINVVRFHHMDNRAFPDGIRARNVAHNRDLDAEALDRLDYFIAQLKRQGIYANLNLLVSRPFNAADGLPAAIERIPWKDRHAAGFFHAPMIELQKEYARKLLSHRNPYTELTYAEDPAVAFIEINNENGLIHGWLGNEVDRLPGEFLADLQRQWNSWLQRRYRSTDLVRKAWELKEEPLGDELLMNAAFDNGTQHWRLERHEKAEASAAVSDDVPPSFRAASRAAKSVRVAITRPSSDSWHVQFHQAGLKVDAKRPYTFTFWAKADKPLTATVVTNQAHPPWQRLGLSVPISLTTEWQEFRFVFEPTANDDNARVGISDLARHTGTIWLVGPSFRPGGIIGLHSDERLETGTMKPFEHARFGERTAAGQRDWLRFLWETEDNYWETMRRYLKDDLKVRAVVIGTIVGCSTPNLMARFDAVDSHAYWHHPSFPGRPWDPEDWFVTNRSMVNETGGTLPGLAFRRVLGKPHCVTEYNHAAPNTFGSEGFLLLAAYGALQDWDALYAFSYSHRRDDWGPGRISGFFDIDQHPTKMVSLVPAMALFMRGDVKPAEKAIVVGLDKEHEVDALRKARSWDLVHAGHLGVSRPAALIHRVAIATGGTEKPANAIGNDSAREKPFYESDTKELAWDLRTPMRGVVTVNTFKSRAAIGYSGGKRFDLGGVVIEPGATSQDGWSAITVTALDGTLASGPARVLITATGYVQNTDMVWKNAEKTSVGRNWGKAPSLVEGIPARITLPLSADRAQAWALGERGERKTALAVQASDDGKAQINLGTPAQTLWYEVSCR
jgi:hypothetical protein